MPAGASTDTAPDRDGSAQPFAHVLCGVDGSRLDRECVSQAARLTGGEGSLRLVAVTWTVGTGLGEMSTLGRSRAQQALEAGRTLARELGIASSAELIEREHASEALLELAGDEDLVVVGAHGGSRASGIVLGSTATAVIHRARTPVLIARTPPEGVSFPDRILLASDGSPESRRAALVAAQIAGAHGASVMLAHVGPDGPSELRHAMAEEAAMVIDSTGRQPVLLSASGQQHEQLCRLAADHRASLVVMGSHGRTGLRALGSVSERVAHGAPCSVLIARPRP